MQIYRLPYIAPITVIIVAPTVAKRVPVKHKIRPIIAIIMNIVCKMLQLFIIFLNLKIFIFILYY
jgi:hypothetical protein